MLQVSLCLQYFHRITAVNCIYFTCNGSLHNIIACSMGSLFAVRLLLDKKRENPLERRDSIGGGGRGFGGDRSAGSATCDVNAFSSNKHTALHIATRHRYMEIVKVLLQVPSASSSHSSLHNFKASVLILQFSRTGPTATL